MAQKPRVLIHYTHNETLGHTTRTLALCHELVRSHANVHVLQGGIPQSFIEFPHTAEVMNIPAPFTSRAYFKNRSTARHYAQRADFVLKAAQRIKPDVFITEFFPLGRTEYLPELLPTLRYLRKKNTRIYSSTGYPYLANLNSTQKINGRSLQDVLVNLYDRILIHTPERLELPYFQASIGPAECLSNYDRFFSANAHKITYTNYILPISEKPSPLTLSRLKVSPKDFTVIVSRGGGAVFPKIIAHAILAQKILGERYRFIITTGPTTSQEERELFATCLKKAPGNNIHVCEYLPDLPYYFKHCNASVSMCGYNTSVELLAANTPSVVIPYINERSKQPTNDQLARSQLLHDHLDATILTYQKISPRLLADAIRQKCETHQPLAPVPKKWFTGAKTSVKIILSKMSN